MTPPVPLEELFDPRRHAPLTATPWRDDAARAAIAQIVTAAEAAFEPARGAWPLHPRDDPPTPGAVSYNLYWGTAGAVWALRHLAAEGAVHLARDYTPWLLQYPERVREEAAHKQHGSASYFFGESGPLLMAWQATREPALADRLFGLVQGNLHNTAREPLWGNPGTMLAAVGVAEALRGMPEVARWQVLLQRAGEALRDEMVIEAQTGAWLWEQDLYGRRGHYLGGGHGLAGNAYAVWRAAEWLPPALVDTVLTRTWQTLAATAMQARAPGEAGEMMLANWHAMADPERLASWRASGWLPLVQDCHGAPGIVVRLAATPQAPEALLRAAGELIWHAGPLAKGPSLCHGTAGSAAACLKLWRRLQEPLWLDRARCLAAHAMVQVEAERAHHGQGRHSLWTGDLGVACVLWQCLRADDRFPTLDVF